MASLEARIYRLERVLSQRASHQREVEEEKERAPFDWAGFERVWEEFFGEHPEWLQGDGWNEMRTFLYGKRS